MKKIYLLIAALSLLTACGPAYYYQRPRTTARVAIHTRSIVQERLDHRSYRLNIEREIRPQRGNVAAVIDIPDFTISVHGDRLRNSRERDTDFRINSYSDSGNSRRRVIRFANYNRRSLEGRYELTVYPEGNFRLIIRKRNNSIQREYEGRVDLGPGRHGPGYGQRPGPAPRRRR